MVYYALVRPGKGADAIFENRELEIKENYNVNAPFPDRTEHLAL